MENKKTVYKWVWVWNFDKEELWLNKMADDGWVLDEVGFCKYVFIRSDSEPYTIRLEMHGIDESYLDHMRETGAEYVGRMVQWIYFRKKVSSGEFNIFSDIDAKIGHLNRIETMLAIIGFANLGIGLANSFNYMHIGWINLLCATLLMYALGRIHGKKEDLLKDRMLEKSNRQI